jgi:hypothetical protein
MFLQQIEVLAAPHSFVILTPEDAPSRAGARSYVGLLRAEDASVAEHVGFPAHCHRVSLPFQGF